MVALIETRQLGRRYGSRRGIAGVSLRIEAGQIFGFLGPNGAGKTTTIRILLGFLKPSEGTALIGGEDSWIASHRIKRNVGYVAGDVRLYPWMTLTRALRIVGQIRGENLVEQGQSLSERFALEPDLPVRKMSRGNRQKLALILALAHQPKIVILDEPTSGLDPLMQLTLMQCLRELADKGSTILFSSHTLSEVEELCDRVAMIRQGHVVVDEGLDTLKARAPRSVHATVADPGDLSQITWPAGVTVVQQAGSVAHVQITGPSISFLRWAAQQPFLDVTIGAPSLESLFRAYYTAESEAA